MGPCVLWRVLCTRQIIYCQPSVLAELSRNGNKRCINAVSTQPRCLCVTIICFFPQPQFISQCMAEIKKELKQENAFIKANAVSKLTYVRFFLAAYLSPPLFAFLLPLTSRDTLFSPITSLRQFLHSSNRLLLHLCLCLIPPSHLSFASPCPLSPFLHLTFPLSS